MMEIAVIDYNAGNIRSVAKALEWATRDVHGTHITASSDPDHLSNADFLVLPGDGAFKTCMAELSAVDGMMDMLQTHAITQQKPFLGICIGMQLLASYGDEDGGSKGLGWISGRVERIKASPPLKCPHMGWNELTFTRHHTLKQGLPDKPHVYFLHSYVFHPDDETTVIATTQHGEKITAIVEKENILGVQFHPEKSQKNGITLLHNILEEMRRKS